MKTGLVISDLHLFSKRSEGEALMEGLSEEIDSVDLLVLNGDTFDFRWSTCLSHAESLETAAEWLGLLIDRFKDRELHFIFGNHDCLSEFREIVEKLAGSSSHFHAHEYMLRLGRCLFLHGDCTNHGMSAEKLVEYRDGWSNDRQRGAMGRAMYDLVDASGLGKLFHKAYFPVEGTVDRLIGHLDDVLPSWSDQLDHCYFGHTHVPIPGVHRRGVEFHNTGSAIRNMGFSPMAFELGEDP